MDEVAIYWLRAAAIGKMVMGAFFLYLCGKMFHGADEVKRAAKKPFEKALANFLIGFVGSLALAAVMVIWTGV